MKKYNSESDLVSLDHSPHFSSFFRKLRSPEYNERRTAEIVADNEIDTLMEEIDQTKPDDIVKQENKFIRKVYRTRPADNDRDFEELAKRVRRGGKKTRKRRKVPRKRRKVTRRRKSNKKKSTRKKRRGGVQPDAPPVTRRNQMTRSRMPHAPLLIQGLNQVRNMPFVYIETAMIRLSDPQVVWNLDQEGRLDEIMNLVTERITFFVSRNQVSREQLREYLDETTEAHQTLQGVDMNLAARYGNFIEGLGQLTN